MTQASNVNVTHPCGATSSACPDFAQIPYEALELLAKRFEIGAVQHGRNNYRKGVGDKDYTVKRINHIIGHCFKLIAQLETGFMSTDEDSPTDNVGAILWGGAFLSVAVPALQKNQALQHNSLYVGTLQANVKPVQLGLWREPVRLTPIRSEST
jgi:hypothetical protein